jgi:hypothetical protein
MFLKFLAGVALSLSFSSLSFAAGLNFSSASDTQLNLINAKTTSCYAQVFDPSKSNDIEARYFTLAAPSFSWGLVDFDLHVTGIHFEIADIPQSSVITKDINGDELRGLFNNSDPKRDNIIVRAPSGDQPTIFKLMCGLTVGGIMLAQEQDVAFSAPVRVTIEGYAVNDAGHDVEIHHSFQITVVNRGANNK